jgi:hypothetical protein
MLVSGAVVRDEGGSGLSPPRSPTLARPTQMRRELLAPVRETGVFDYLMSKPVDVVALVELIRARVSTP